LTSTGEEAEMKKLPDSARCHVCASDARYQMERFDARIGVDDVVFHCDQHRRAGSVPLEPASPAAATA
jgi:hypothetical protein